jgi:lysophospholipase L1-like esterase
MKFTSLKIIFLAISLSIIGSLQAQQPKYASEFREFNKQDSIKMPPKGGILLIGSSSFRKWTDVQSYFPGYTIINRSFGGSVLPEVSAYADQNIAKYHPKQVIIYCGENDLASSDTVTPMVVFNRFKQLFKIIKSRAGEVNVTFVSIKPSPIRKKIQLKVEEANKMIEAFLKTRSGTAFIDVYHPMLVKGRDINGTIFTSDSLHMNPKGYAIWKKVMLPYMMK